MKEICRLHEGRPRSVDAGGGGSSALSSAVYGRVEKVRTSPLVTLTSLSTPIRASRSRESHSNVRRQLIPKKGCRRARSLSYYAHAQVFHVTLRGATQTATFSRTLRAAPKYDEYYFHCRCFFLAQKARKADGKQERHQPKSHTLQMKSILFCSCRATPLQYWGPTIHGCSGSDDRRRSMALKTTDDHRRCRLATEEHRCKNGIRDSKLAQATD